MRNLLFVIIFLVIVINYSEADEYDWPVAPTDTVHALGNNWGEYQDYSGWPYMHSGIDIMGDTVPVYSVSHGWVKCWDTYGGDYYWRVAVGDSEDPGMCDGWLYAHIDPYKYHVDVGDEVFPGDLVGYLIDWPVTGFTHCHFARIRDDGEVWDLYWLFVQNPLNLLTPNWDSEAPVIEMIPSLWSLFGFCVDNTSQYLLSDSLYGDVDIIARIYDEFGLPLLYSVWEKLIPYKIEYSILGEKDTIGPILSVMFGGFLDWDNESMVHRIYKDDYMCDTQGDYNYREYYFIVTNTDGDSVTEVSDTAGCWRTTDLPDGSYWVHVTAYDQYGNSTSDSMEVDIRNLGVSEDTANVLVAHYGLALQGPNPFKHFTDINYQIQAQEPGGEFKRASLKIYSLSGRLVDTLVDGMQKPGYYTVRWAAGDFPPGVYFALLEVSSKTPAAGCFNQTVKLIRIH